MNTAEDAEDAEKSPVLCVFSVLCGCGLILNY